MDALGELACPAPLQANQQSPQAKQTGFYSLDLAIWPRSVSRLGGNSEEHQPNKHESLPSQLGPGPSLHSKCESSLQHPSSTPSSYNSCRGLGR